MNQHRYDDDTLIQSLRASGNAQLTDEAKARLTRAILSSIDTEPVTRRGDDRFKKHSSFFSMHPMIPTIVLILLLALGTGTALAADNARPGDPLFGIDQAMERARLSFALSTETKAKVAADIAEERQEERQELEEENRVSALDEANRHVDDALERASESLEKVREEMDDKDVSERVSDAIQKTEEKLTNLQIRQQETITKAVSALTEAKVILQQTSATVKLELKDKKSSFRLETVDRNAIIKEIAKRTGIAESVIRSVIQFETENDESEDTDITPENSNQNVNQEHEDENVNGDDDSPADETDEERPETRSSPQWKIEVRIHENSAEVHAEKAGEKQEWTVPSSAQASILTSIAARTGLTVAEIGQIWDLEVEN